MLQLGGSKGGAQSGGVVVGAEKPTCQKMPPSQGWALPFVVRVTLAKPPGSPGFTFPSYKMRK